MLEYEFEEVSCGEVYGFYLRETAAHPGGHRPPGGGMAGDMWDASPKARRRPYGFIESIDLVFERQRPET